MWGWCNGVIAVDAEVLAEIRALPVRRRSALEAGLSALLARISEDGPLPIRDAKNQFTAVNRAAAKQGHAQLVKGAEGEETVIISIRDLASIIQTAAESMTLADALTLSHFRPAGGSLVHREANESENAFSLEAAEA
jgi:hypothetical protein